MEILLTVTYKFNQDKEGITMKNGFRYHCEIGIVDWFFGSMTKEEIINSYQDELEAVGCSGNTEEFANDINFKEKSIISTIQAEQDEDPFIIRYFVTPAISGLSMEVSAVVKISNNGSTFLFTNNELLLAMYSDL